MEKIAVERSIWIDAPRERVWRAVTEPAQLQQWYAPGCLWEIPRLEVGGAVRFHHTSTEILPATIAVLDKPHQFVLNWHPVADNPGAQIITTFLLVEDGSGTQITVTDSGFETMPEDGCENGMGIEDIDAGYAASLKHLKSMLENDS